MDRRALGAAASMRTFAALALLTAAGLSLPGTLVTLRTTAADAARGTVTETITSAYRTGR